LKFCPRIMKNLFLATIVVFLLAGFLSLTNAAGTADDSEDAKLLVQKNVLNNFVVEGFDTTVKYTIFNVGSIPAVNVQLKDTNFPSDKFEYVSGFNTVQWSKISPASNVSHVAVVRPKMIGLFNFTHASVTYTANDKTARVQTGYSTELGETYIQRQKEYSRRFASHSIDWAMFVVIASPCIVFPYLLWFSSKRKYESIKSKKERVENKEK